MSRSPHYLLGVALLLVATPLILAACDAGDAVSDIDSLLTDARIARQAGDIDLAISLLESAHAQEPENAPVRVELGSAYLASRDIDLVDVDRIALYLTTYTEGEGVTQSPPVQRVGDACVYEDDPNAHQFEPGEYEGYVELYADRELIQDVQALLGGADPADFDLTLMPDELRALSVCSGIIDGHLVYDADAALASLRALGLTDDEIATALAVNAVVLFMEAYFFVVEDVPQQTAWYHVESKDGSETSIGICSEDPDALLSQVEDAVADLGESITSLDLRDVVLGGDTASSALVEHVLDAYESIQEELGAYCEAGE